MRKRSVALTGALLATAVSLTGCGVTSHVPDILKAAAASERQSPQPSQTISPSVTTPIVQVKHPWKAGQFQKGVQLTLNSPADTMAIDAGHALDYIVSLSANSVSLSFPISVDSQTPLKVYAADDTPSAKTVGRVVQEAKARNLRVTLRPYIEQFDYRSKLDPINPGSFFKMYRRLLSPYLTMANSQDVDEFVLGDEMTSLQTSKAWYTVAAYAKYRFKGELSYDLNAAWQHKPPAPGSFGVNFYPETSLRDGASIEHITKVLSAWITKQQRLLHTSLTLDEVSIAGISGALQKPYQVPDGNTFSQPATQAKWFAAAYRAAKQAGTHGIYFAPLSTTQQFGSALNVEKQPSNSFVGRSDQYIRALFN